jgi:hypothetical protein
MRRNEVLQEKHDSATFLLFKLSNFKQDNFFDNFQIRLSKKEDASTRHGSKPDFDIVSFFI